MNFWVAAAAGAVVLVFGMLVGAVGVLVILLGLVREGDAVFLHPDQLMHYQTVLGIPREEGVAHILWMDAEIEIEDWR